MNDLQLALLGIGSVLVGGIWGYSKWQERRHRQRAELLLDKADGDALLSASTSDDHPILIKPRQKEVIPALERREPVIGIKPVVESIDVDDSLEFVGGEPAPVPDLLAPLADAPEREKIAPAQAKSLLPVGEPSMELLSPEVDFISSFELAEPVLGDVLLGISRSALQMLKKRIVWVGFDQTGPGWGMLRSGGEYRSLRIGMQLADRAGPVSHNMLEQFRRAMEGIADELTAVANMPSAREALGRSVNLDRICAEVDIQLTVHVVARRIDFTLKGLRDAAMKLGFRLGPDGLLSYVDAGGSRLFILDTRNDAKEGGVQASFIYELPCVPNGEVAFARMMVVASEFSDAVDGILVDEHKRPLSERFVDQVSSQIRDLQAHMNNQGIVPGGELALRLFA